MFSRYLENLNKRFKGMALITGLLLLLGFLIAANFADRDNALLSQAGEFSTQVAINLSPNAVTTVVGGVDIILAYDETKLNFNRVSAGNPGTGEIVLANDSGTAVRVGLIHPDGLDIPHDNPVLIFSFDVIQGSASQAGDFIIVDAMVADLLKGTDMGLDVSDVSFTIDSRVAGVDFDVDGSVGYKNGGPVAIAKAPP